MCAFRVTSVEQIIKNVLPHFDKYPLITQKYTNYNLFKEIVILMMEGEHLNAEGLKKIINFKASLNLGLPEILKIAFPDVLPTQNLLKPEQKIPHPE
jgi:hypothetical protein